LREAGREGALIDDKRQSVRIQSAAADTLWTRDEPTARGFFLQSFQKATDYYRETNDDNMETRKGSSFTRRDDLRLEVIKLTSKHDAQLARTFTDQYVSDLRAAAEARPATSGPGKGPEMNPALFGKTDAGSRELLMAAASLIETDQKMAMELAMRSISGGIPMQMAGFLNQLGNKSRESADAVFQASLKRLTSEPQPAPGQLLILAAYPFGENRVMISDGGNVNSMGFDKARDFALNDKQIDSFLMASAFVLTRASEINATATPDMAPRYNSAIFAARYLEPKVAQYKPAMLEDWRALSTKLQSASTDKVREGIDDSLRESATQRDQGSAPVGAPDRVKSMLDAADQAKSFDEKDQRLMSAAMTAMQNGEYARALGIVERISDTDYRDKGKAWVSSRAAVKAIEEKRLEDAIKYANDVPETDERAYLFYQIASIAVSNQDKGRAMELLEDAVRYVSKADVGLGKLRALIGLASLYLRLDVARSFEVLGDAVKVADKIGSYSPDDARLVRTLTNKQGNSSMVSISNVEAFDFSRTFAAFAAVDFDRALTLANSFESKSLKYAAMIAVAGKLLERTPAKAT
jgi:tetratricopeptide (TPR) repeat protein